MNITVVKTYVEFAVKEFRALLFGVNFTFLSCIGQTFFISLFVPNFIETFELSKSGFGTIYSTLTLTSAAVIPTIGGWIDSTSPKTYSLWVISGLIAGSIVIASAWHVIVLVVGLFLVRLTGQGLSTHTSKTTVARHYREERGKALGIVTLGLPLGEGVLPLGITALMSVISWQFTWITVGVTVLLIFLPLQYWLLSTSDIRDPSHATDKIPRDEGDPNDQSDDYGQLYVYRSVLKEWEFWILAPAVVLPGFWITGLFLYQTTIVERFQGWSMPVLATAFIGYAVARIGFSLGIGPAIDRWSARILFPLYLVPFAIGVLTAYFHPGRWSAFAYMALLGVTMGAGSGIKTALWAEIYGRNVIGRIRSLFSSLSVFSTSVSPVLMGWLIDVGVSLETILLWATMSAVVTAVGSIPALHSKS